MTEQELKDTLGKNISTRRIEIDWSQETLSEKAGVTKNTISDIETGRKFARAKTLVRLAEAFHTDVYELLKPEGVYPDKTVDIIANYKREVKDAVEKIGNNYLKNLEK